MYKLTQQIYLLAMLCFPFVIGLFGCGGSDCPAPINPCDTVFCRNGGICDTITGACSCPDNTKGELCEIRLPISLEVEEIAYKPRFFTTCSSTLDTRIVARIRKRIANSSSLGEVSVSLNGSSPSTVFQFSPDILLDVNTSYKMEIERVCRQGDLNGNAIVESWSFVPSELYDDNNLSYFTYSYGDGLSGNPLMEIKGKWIYD